jgi:hypothetical protein
MHSPLLEVLAKNTLVFVQAIHPQIGSAIEAKVLLPLYKGRFSKTLLDRLGLQRRLFGKDLRRVLEGFKLQGIATRVQEK